MIMGLLKNKSASKVRNVRVMPRSRKAQQTMSMPFGMIFSIILIVAFIAVAFMAIKYFLGIADCSKVGQFYNDLQSKVDEGWRSASSEFNMSIVLPSGIKKVCFANLSEPALGDKATYNSLRIYSVNQANTFVIPSEKGCGMAFRDIKHINLPEIIKSRNPYCIDVSRNIVIKKDLYDKLVLLK